MFFRKPGLPILMARLPDGREVPYWNTFYQEVRYAPVDAQDLMPLGLQYGEANDLAHRINQALAQGEKPAQMELPPAVRELLESRRRYLGQMDLNLNSPLVWDYYDETLRRLADYGAAIVRLDAFAYAPKEVGAKNFLNDPGTWDFLQELTDMAQPYGMALLPEIHASYEEGIYRVIGDKGYMVYDFFLPGLLLDAFEQKSGQVLAQWANEILSTGMQTVNMLGCHDGIPVLDLKGLLPEERIQGLIDTLVKRGGFVKDLHGAKNVYYQVNATYYSALGADDRKMLLARAIQLFMPGKPQVWYLDLFAGKNDLAAAPRGGEAAHKEINRTNLTSEQVKAGLEQPVTRDQIKLLRLYNGCPAFDGELTVEQPEAHRLCLRWRKGDSQASLDADLRTLAFTARMDGETFVQA